MCNIPFLIFYRCTFICPLLRAVSLDVSNVNYCTKPMPTSITPNVNHCTTPHARFARYHCGGAPFRSLSAPRAVICFRRWLRPYATHRPQVVAGTANPFAPPHPPRGRLQGAAGHRAVHPLPYLCDCILMVYPFSILPLHIHLSVRCTVSLDVPNVH
jgi:hypothetical protein